MSKMQNLQARFSFFREETRIDTIARHTRSKRIRGAQQSCSLFSCPRAWEPENNAVRKPDMRQSHYFRNQVRRNGSTLLSRRERWREKGREISKRRFRFPPPPRLTPWRTPLKKNYQRNEKPILLSSVQRILEIVCLCSVTRFSLASSCSANAQASVACA